jgi:virginiamycin B lyase
LPTAACYPFRIVVGGDGNLWFSEPGCNRVGRITMTGEITEFVLPQPDLEPNVICLGPDGNIWATEFTTGSTAVITPTGVITEYSNVTSDESRLQA